MYDKNLVKRTAVQPGNGNRRRTQWADVMKSKGKKATKAAYKDHSPAFNTEAKNECSYTSLLLTLLYCVVLNTSTPNDPYSGRTAPLTSKVSFYIFIQHI